MLRLARIEHALMRVDALVGREQSRVDVDDAPRPSVDEAGREQPHISRECDIFDVRVAQRAINDRVEFGALHAFVAQCELGNAVVRGER